MIELRKNGAYSEICQKTQIFSRVVNVIKNVFLWPRKRLFNKLTMNVKRGSFNGLKNAM